MSTNLNESFSVFPFYDKFSTVKYLWLIIRKKGILTIITQNTYIYEISSMS